MNANFGRICKDCLPEQVSKVKAHLTSIQAVARGIDPEIWQANAKADELAKEQASTRYDTRDRIDFSQAWGANEAILVATAKALKRQSMWFT